MSARKPLQRFEVTPMWHMYNLELLTRGRHYGAHGNVYYQKWQESLGLLARAYRSLDVPELRYKITSMFKEYGFEEILKGG